MKKKRCMVCDSASEKTICSRCEKILRENIPYADSKQLLKVFEMPDDEVRLLISLYQNIIDSQMKYTVSQEKLLKSQDKLIASLKKENSLLNEIVSNQEKLIASHEVILKSPVMKVIMDELDKAVKQKKVKE